MQITANTYDEEGMATYAIRIHPGLDRQGAVAHIVKTVKAAIQVVVSVGAKGGAET